MAMETFELGPLIDKPAIDFSLPDCNGTIYTLSGTVGEKGVILGFIGDIWHATSVRRILWLQHNLHKLAMMGTPVMLMVRDHPTTLYGFHASTPLPVPFPMLADEKGNVHSKFNMDRHPGLVLIDGDLHIRAKWLMPSERVWPKVAEIEQAIATL